MTTLPKQRSSWSSRVVAVTCVLYALSIALVGIALWMLADRWWPATVLLFAPRWTLALPLVLLVPMAAVFHRTSLATLGAAATLLVTLVMGYTFAFGSPGASRDPLAVRVLSCNIHRQKLDAEAFRRLVESTQPDVIALQDWTSQHEAVLFGDRSWHTHREGELFLASRFPILRTDQIVSPPSEKPGFNVRYGAATAYELATPSGPITLVNVHFASPHEALQTLREGNPSFIEQLSFNSQQRDIEASAVADYLDTVSGPLVVVGDFNTPRESPLFRRHFGTYQNAFSQRGRGFGLTYVSTASSVRIDHILSNTGFDVRECWLGEAVGSPHRPVLADLVPDTTATLRSASAAP